MTDPAIAAAAFALPGVTTVHGRYGNGHINDTWLVESAGERFVLQALNPLVFPDGEVVMRNIAGVLAHLAPRIAEQRRCLRLIPTRAGTSWWVDPAGRHWRLYRFIAGTVTVERVAAPEQAWAAAHAFASFQAALADYAGPPLGETIPDFHHTPKRLARLRAAVAADAHGRLAAVRDEIAWALGQERLAGSLLAAHAAGSAPARIAHNDTKINNVMLDERTGEGICVIDLDTVMPGLGLYDAGDLIRTATCPLAEDHDRPEEMAPDPRLLAAVIDGWRAGAGAALGAAECALIPLAGAVMTFEVGIRFLTDWLDGDRYFRIKHPEHNRLRARAQLSLARALVRLPAVAQVLGGEAKTI